MRLLALFIFFIIFIGQLFLDNSQLLGEQMSSVTNSSIYIRRYETSTFRPNLLMIKRTIENQAAGMKYRSELEIDTVKQEIQESDSLPMKSDPFWGAIALGLGHHDDFTKAKSSNMPELQTSGFYFSFNPELGVIVRNLKLASFFRALIPMPPSPVVNGYKNKTGEFSGGFSSRVRVFPRGSKFNISTISGYKWIRERGEIFDPAGIKPTLLDAKYVDKGPIFGANTSLSLGRETVKKVVLDVRIAFEYVREHLRTKANKFHLALETVGYLKSIESSAREKKKFTQQAGLTLGFEWINRSDGRKDYFFTFIFNFEDR